jgi:hypothetical protein
MNNETSNPSAFPNAGIPTNLQLDIQPRRCARLSWRIQVRLVLIAATATVFALNERAAAQIALPTVTLVQVAGPGNGYPTEQVSFCFSKIDWKYTPENNGPSESGESFFLPKKKANVMLRIIDESTGHEVAKKSIAITPGALPSDPCVRFVVPAITPTSTALASLSIGVEAIGVPAVLSTPYIGVVSVSSQPVPPSIVTSSLEIFSLGANGLPVNPRVIPSSVTCPADEFPCSY